MPLPSKTPIISCLILIQTGFTFLVLAYPGFRGNETVTQVCSSSSTAAACSSFSSWDCETWWWQAAATGDDEIDWGEDTSDAAVKARQEAELSGAMKNIVISDDVEKSAQERVDMFYSFVKVCSISHVWF